jgi:hypothetical protein
MPPVAHAFCVLGDNIRRPEALLAALGNGQPSRSLDFQQRPSLLLLRSARSARSQPTHGAIASRQRSSAPCASSCALGRYDRELKEAWERVFLPVGEGDDGAWTRTACAVAPESGLPSWTAATFRRSAGTCARAGSRAARFTSSPIGLKSAGTRNGSRTCAIGWEEVRGRRLRQRRTAAPDRTLGVQPTLKLAVEPLPLTRSRAVRLLRPPASDR